MKNIIINSIALAAGIVALTSCTLSKSVSADGSETLDVVIMPLPLTDDK